MMLDEEREMMELLVKVNHSTDSLMIGMGLMIACMVIVIVYLGWDYSNKKNNY